MPNYQKICQDLLKDLPQRQKEVILRRFGLAPENNQGREERETLEAIGKNFGITRERVRQIEEDGFSRIKPRIVKYQKVFQYFNRYLKRYGGLRKEEILLEELGGKKQKAQVCFLLTVSEGFKRFGDNEDFHSFWALNSDSFKAAKDIIDTLSKKLREIGKPLSLEELKRKVISEIKKPALASCTEPWPVKRDGARWKKRFISSTLEISKKILLNSDSFYGLGDWPEINPRGVKDKAYLVFKKLGKPLHFDEVAKFIEGGLTQTVHNELIKDPRFVLVGRGIYALKEWGYEPGQVKDVISRILREAGPLTQGEILERVLKQRLVKENTILLNLSNKKQFLRNSQGKYKINPVIA